VEHMQQARAAHGCCPLATKSTKLTSVPVTLGPCGTVSSRGGCVSHRCVTTGPAPAACLSQPSGQGAHHRLELSGAGCNQLSSHPPTYNNNHQSR
jgi:hypothetical protein